MALVHITEVPIKAFNNGKREHRVLTEALADDIGREVVLVDHLRAGVVQHHDGVAVGRHLRLEGLMLLDLGLDRQIHITNKSHFSIQMPYTMCRAVAT